MTVAAQVKQTIASLKGTRATLDTFASFEQAEDQKILLEQNAQRIDKIVQRLENRVQVLEFEEPQYKGL